MTDSMKKYLTAASQPRGTCVRNINDHLTASKAGWVKTLKPSQNCVNFRYGITEAGKSALGAAV